MVGYDSAYSYTGHTVTTTNLYGVGVGSPVTAAGGVSITWIPYHHYNETAH